MPQIRFNNVSLSFGEHALLDGASFSVEKKDRIAIIGRNGAGKSTTLKLIQQELTPDDGNIEFQKGLSVHTMPQHVPQNLTGSVFDFVSAAADHEHEWESYSVDRVLTELHLDPELLLENASGGQIRRILLATALVNDPDVLLLDEPTNHLDIESILWLENLLLNYHKTIIFITHDREFMEKISTRIFEIDLGKVTAWDGNYSTFLKNKASALAAEEKEHKNFDKKLAQEEVWIRQGIKARRTRNEGRVRALEQMRRERAQRRTRSGSVSVDQQKVTSGGKIAFELDKLSLSFGEHKIFEDFSSIIASGDKIGIIGPNGCGKSCFIKVLLGETAPTSGSIKNGSKQEIVYFDQHRMQLDLEMTAIDNVAEGREWIEVNGQQKHIMSYLQEFLFTPHKARSYVKTFSGGERNRLLLARLLSKPSNVLVLDEPTNDLDMETLDFLEEYLLNYKGTLIIVSHDRALLNNVVTSTIVFEEDSKLQEYVGGYDDWQRQIAASKIQSETSTNKSTEKKLSYNEQKELKKLPAKIESVDKKIKALHDEMAGTDFYEKSAEIQQQKQEELAAMEAKQAKLFQRWEDLEG